MASAENQAFREQALQEIIQACEGTANALDEHGGPGIQRFGSGSVSSRTVEGWEVELGRPDPAIAPPRLELGKPDCRCYADGQWLAGIFSTWYLRKIVLAVGARDGFCVAFKVSGGYTDYHRNHWRWETKSFPDYAADVLTDQATWMCQCAAAGAQAAITEHAGPAEYRAYVGEVVRVISAAFASVRATHLSRLDKTERNRAARHAAIADMVSAIEETYAALAASGNPGIGPVAPHPRHEGAIDGWRVPVNWSALTVPVPAITPPPTNRIGNWTFPDNGSHRDFGHVALTADGNVAVSWHLSTSPWIIKTPAEYATWVLQDWMTWWGHSYEPEPQLIADYTEPGEFQPYVQAIAHIVSSAFRTLHAPS